MEINAIVVVVFCVQQHTVVSWNVAGNREMLDKLLKFFALSEEKNDNDDDDDNRNNNNNMKNKRKRSTFICTSSREQLSELSAGALVSAKQRISITVHSSKKRRMKQTRTKKIVYIFLLLKMFLCHDTYRFRCVRMARYMRALCSNVYTAKWTRSRKQFVTHRKKSSIFTYIVCVIMGFLYRRRCSRPPPSPLPSLLLPLPLFAPTEQAIECMAVGIEYGLLIAQPVAARLFFAIASLFI